MNIVERVVQSSRGIVMQKSWQPSTPKEEGIFSQFKKSYDSKKKIEYPFSMRELSQPVDSLEREHSPVFGKNLLIDDPNVPVRDPQINTVSLNEEKERATLRNPLVS